MYSYTWDAETGGLLLNSSPLAFSKEPRPVYYRELDILGFDKHWQYAKDDRAPYLWAEANNYYYRGRLVARTKGGSLYTAPELEIIEAPEPDGAPLRPVDLAAMTEKNRDLLDKLAAETIRRIYNTYIEYKKKVDVFYVAFSGGKDSIAVLDLVQRALPHNEFDVLFGDTDMEFPETYKVVEQVEKLCIEKGISFRIAKASLSSKKSWELFGPPARKIRWCCTVHKTAPVINKLREVYAFEQMHTMMITGVRSDESAARSDYDELSMGKKLAGQFSFHPLLEWASHEIYLYIFAHGLILNPAYMYGFNRVGCIMCPNSTEKHEFIKRRCHPDLVDDYCHRIIATSGKDLSGSNAKKFLETGGWKTRLTGRELKFSEQERYSFEETSRYYEFRVTQLKDDWKIWYKTVGEILIRENEIDLEFKGVWRNCFLTSDGTETLFKIENLGRTQNSIEFIYLFKRVLIKSQYCIECGTCKAECPYNNISMENGVLTISDECIKCRACLKIPHGCLFYNSIKESKSMKSLKGINRYLSLGVDANWIKKYVDDNTFEPGNRRTDVMFGFLGDAGLVSKRKITPAGKKVFSLGLNNTQPWALMVCTLVYTPAFNWLVKNIPFKQSYVRTQLDLDMGDETTKKAKDEFWNGFKVILSSNAALQEIGIGTPELLIKVQRTGETRKTLQSITRMPWQNPDPLVVLYSLYKFAEACNGYYQFTLTRLLDHDVESDGVSPTEIFGIDRGQMEKLLSGLTFNHPDFITASFTLDLDNITLNAEKTSADVLELF